MDTAFLAAVEHRLGIRFKTRALLATALTHSSYARQHKQPIEDNERLEFFGDAVVKLVVSEFLFKRFPQSNEGELTKKRAGMVSDKSLASLAEGLGLGRWMVFSHGEKQSGGSQKTSNLANGFEAVLGAYYLDSGLEAARAFFEPLLETLLTAEISADPKSELQEFQQRKHKALPRYTVVKTEGPDHQKTFHVALKLSMGKDSLSFEGQGATKKEAEQAAAKQALDHLKATP
ncbi:MAG: ribonuclease III [Candidatus Margulisiibacteriota bacterium]